MHGVKRVGGELFLAGIMTLLTAHDEMRKGKEAEAVCREAI